VLLDKTVKFVIVLNHPLRHLSRWPKGHMPGENPNGFSSKASLLSTFKTGIFFFTDLFTLGSLQLRYYKGTSQNTHLNLLEEKIRLTTIVGRNYT